MSLYYFFLYFKFKSLQIIEYFFINQQQIYIYQPYYSYLIKKQIIYNVIINDYQSEDIDIEQIKIKKNQKNRYKITVKYQYSKASMQFQQKYTILQQLATSTSSDLYKIKRNLDSAIFIVKKVHYSKMQQKQKQQIVQQVNILTELNSNYIVKYYQHFLHKQQNILYVVMQYEAVDLQQVINKYKEQNKMFTEEKVWKLFKQIVLALKQIHKNKKGTILHRNIQPKSVFISNNSIKLGNFKFVKKLDSEDQFATTILTDTYYMSPQQLQQGIFTAKSDIWALGCLLYEICTFTNPFDGKNTMQIGKRIREGKLKALPSFYKKQLNRVIRWCLAKDPNDRPSLEDLLGIPMVNILIRQNTLFKMNKKIGEKEKKVNLLQDQIAKLQQTILNIKKSISDVKKQTVYSENKENHRYCQNNVKYDLQLKRGISDKMNDKLNYTRNSSVNSSQLTNMTNLSERFYSTKDRERRQNMNSIKNLHIYQNLNI